MTSILKEIVRMMVGEKSSAIIIQDSDIKALPDLVLFGDHNDLEKAKAIFRDMTLGQSQEFMESQRQSQTPDNYYIILKRLIS